MSDRRGSTVADLRLLADDIEAGRAIVTSCLTTSCKYPGGLTSVQVYVRRAPELEPASFNGIEFPAARVRLLAPHETPALNAACTGPVYEPEPEGAEET